MQIVIFCVLGIVLFTFFSLPTLYQLQIKEYYFPRIKAGLKEKEGFWIPMRMPAISLRNILITILTFLITSGYYYLLYKNYQDITYSFIFLWVLGTLISKFVCIIGVFVTEPIALLKRENLIKKAMKKIEESKTTFIGVTGSYGKTSVKEYLIKVLGDNFKVEGTKANYNSEVGVAISVLDNLKEETDYFIAELAAYNLGTIKKSASIIKPKIAFITGLGNQHISIFGSQKNIYDGKGELVDALPENGTLYINMDCEGSDYVSKKAKCKVIKYSIKSKAADIYGEVLSNSEFKFQYNHVEEVFNTQLIGEHNILNLLGVIGCALDNGIKLSEIKNIIKNIKPVKQRMNLLKSKKNGIMIDNSYNTNSEGFMSALKVLSSYNNRKKYVLTRGMLELGEELIPEYTKIINYCKSNKISIITSDKRFSGLSDVVTVMNEKKINEFLVDNLLEDVILLQGRFSPPFMKIVYENYE